MIEKALHQKRWGTVRLDGSTKDRQAAVNQFSQDSSCPFFLISLKAGGTGLNLTEAEYVYIMDPWWNPAAENQAIDRAYRIGQKRQVNAYRLVSENTVEDKMLELQAIKRKLSNEVIEEGALKSQLSKDDLSNLLK